MITSTTDFRANINKYIKLLEKDDIFVRRNGDNIVVALNPNKNKRAILDSVLGVLPEGAAKEFEKTKLDRIIKKWKG